MATDLGLLAADPSRLTGAAVRAPVLDRALVADRRRLDEAVRWLMPDRAVEVREAAAEMIRLYRRFGLSPQERLAVSELVRRAERGVAVIVRRMQAKGLLASKADGGGPVAVPYERTINGRVRIVSPPAEPRQVRPSPSQFFKGGEDGHRAYLMADCVTDGQFEEILAVARRAGVMTRVYVSELCRNWNTPALAPRAPAAAPGREAAPGQLGNSTGGAHTGPPVTLARAGDQRTAITNTLAALAAIEAATSRIETLHPDVDAEEAGQWLADLNRSRRALGGLQRILKERTNVIAVTE